MLARSQSRFWWILISSILVALLGTDYKALHSQENLVWKLSTNHVMAFLFGVCTGYILDLNVKQEPIILIKKKRRYKKKNIKKKK